MRIGVPRETKTGERRVALTPEHVRRLSDRHEVVVERDAGTASGFDDLDYEQAGARVVEHAEAWSAELVVKVKELQAAEEDLLGEGQVLFCYTHLFGHPELVEKLRAAGVTAIDFQTVEDGDGGTPLLAPMSEVAGRLATLVAAELLRSPPGRGLLLGGPGDPGTVLVLGYGAAGREARRCAEELGCRTFVLAGRARDEDGVRIDDATPENVRDALPKADAVIGAAFSPGRPSPVLVSRQDLALLRPGSVLVDVAIDGGGCFETSRETSHADPWYVEEGIVHYAVPNMPAVVPVSASRALSAAVLGYVERLADGIDAALEADPGLRRGLQVHQGAVLAEGLA